MATVAVSVTDAATGTVVHSETRRAFNSGIRASEDAVRGIARSEDAIYDAAPPTREGDVYTRRWTSRWGHGRTLVATITKEGPSS